MKLIIKSLALLFLLVIASCKSGKGNYVYDGADAFNEEEVSKLNEHIAAIDKNSSVQILVYATPGLSDKTIEEYALEIFDKYGVGNKGINNGIVILLAPNQREINISVGYGLEWILTDEKCGDLISMMTPFFKNANYFSGIDKGLSELENIVSKKNWSVKSIDINNIVEKDTGKVIKFRYTNKGNHKFKYAAESDNQFSPEFRITLAAEDHDFQLFYTKTMNSLIADILTKKDITVYARLVNWRSKKLELLGVEK